MNGASNHIRCQALVRNGQTQCRNRTDPHQLYESIKPPIHRLRLCGIHAMRRRRHHDGSFLVTTLIDGEPKYLWMRPVAGVASEGGEG